MTSSGDEFLKRMEVLVQVLDEQLALPMGVPLMKPDAVMDEVERRLRHGA